MQDYVSYSKDDSYCEVIKHCIKTKRAFLLENATSLQLQTHQISQITLMESLVMKQIMLQLNQMSQVAPLQ